MNLCFVSLWVITYLITHKLKAGNSHGSNQHYCHFGKNNRFGGDKILAPLQELKIRESLANWMGLSCQLQVAGGSRHTERAKRQDLQKFLWFYSQQLGHNQVRYWTPSLTRVFPKHL